MSSTYYYKYTIRIHQKATKPPEAAPIDGENIRKSANV